MKKILDYVEHAKSIAIAGHIRPDGDCVGSCLALCRYLKQNTKAQVTVYLEPPSGKLAGLPGANEICSDIRSKESCLPQVDLFFALDCGDRERLGFVGKLFKAAKKTICIDHHVTNTAFADENIVDGTSSSTSQLLFELMEEDKIDLETAECLYTGILHDTGVFHHVCTGARTMQIAGILMEKGLNFSKMIDEGFYQRSYLQSQILGRCLMESSLLWNGLGIVSYLTRDVMKFYGVTSGDLSGIIDQLRLTAGVEVAIFLYETSPHSYKVSMRSNGDLDVSKVAVHFGGGGHIKAAGCDVKGTAHDIIHRLTAQLELQMVELGIL